jgi:hypothetical protein
METVRVRELSENIPRHNFCLKKISIIFNKGKNPKLPTAPIFEVIVENHQNFGHKKSSFSRFFGSIMKRVKGAHFSYLTLEMVKCPRLRPPNSKDIP